MLLVRILHFETPASASGISNKHDTCKRTQAARDKGGRDRGTIEAPIGPARSRESIEQGAYYNALCMRTMLLH